MATMERGRGSESETIDVINNGMDRSDVFLRAARVQERVADRRFPSTPDVENIISVRGNAIGHSVYLFFVSDLSHIGSAVVNIGLVVAGLVVLSLHWADDDVCDAVFRGKWRWWALVLIVTKAIMTPARLVRWRLFRQPPEKRNRILDQCSKNLLRVLGWLSPGCFILGHVYLLQSRSCKDRVDSPIFQLSVAIIIVTYWRCLFLMTAGICFLTPATGCCLPFVIQVMTMLQHQGKPGRALLQQKIDGLPTVKYGETESIQDGACAICLARYAEDNELKILPCNHAFHTWCADSWLALDQSCPICGTHSFDTSEEEEKKDDAGQMFV